MHRFAFDFAFLEMADTRQHAGRYRGWQRGGENEPGRERPDAIDELIVRRDIAAHQAERLGERTFDDIHAMHRAVARRHTCATSTVKADAVDFVQIGQCAIFSARSHIAPIGPKSPSIE